MKEFYLGKVYKKLCEKLELAINILGNDIPRWEDVKEWEMLIFLPAVKEMVKRTWNTWKWNNGAPGNPSFSNIYNNQNGVFLLVYPTHCSLLDYPIGGNYTVQIHRYFKDPEHGNEWSIQVLNTKRHIMGKLEYLICETY
jgi:hypothetical protein